MKKSAVIRIIMWILVIVILLGILFTGLGIRLWKPRTAGEPRVTAPLLLDEASVGPCTAKETVNIRSGPSMSKSVIGVLNPDETAIVEKIEEVNGRRWAYISSPVQGWIVAEYLTGDSSGTDAAAPATEALAPEGAFANPYTVKEAMNVRETPSLQAPIAGMLDSGDTVIVEKIENVTGMSWAYISSPAQGWVITEYLTGDSSGADAAVDNITGNITVPADQVSKISIDWVSGAVTIQPGDVSEISFYEESSNEKYPMVWKLRDGKLSIQFCQDHSFPHSFSFTLNKDLTVLVPKDWSCEELELDTASTDLYVSALTIREVEVDSASGICRFQDCDIMDMEIDTASGDVYLEGTLNTLDFDAASAKFTGVLRNTPSRMAVDSMSGKLDLTLPEDTGFTVKMDGMSSGFTSDFPTTMRSGNHVCGDGRCIIDIDGMSSDVNIRKGENAPSTQPTEAEENTLPSLATLPTAAAEVPAAPDSPTAPEAPAAPKAPTAP